MSDFGEQSTRLQTSPESGFVHTTVCMRFTHDGNMRILRGAVLQQLDGNSNHSEVIDNPARYAAVLNDQFDLHLPDVNALWVKVWARHQAWVKAQS